MSSIDNYFYVEKSVRKKSYLIVPTFLRLASPFSKKLPYVLYLSVKADAFLLC